MTALLGCIADDFTGGTDLANTLVRNGMRTVQTNGLPEGDAKVDCDALIVSLKCRSCPPQEAVQDCRRALAWLRRQGCRQFFWKYCSTFDSTPKGNIGPVAEALLQDLETGMTLVCPAFPENNRTLYKGNLFVGDVPLAESSMRDHPVTPMRDSNLKRLLEPQVSGKVDILTWDTVRKGTDALREALLRFKNEGVRFVIADALEDADLAALGAACADFPLITGGSGISLGLPANFARQGLLQLRQDAGKLPPVSGSTVILSGSCSQATRGQLAGLAASKARERHPMRRLDPLELCENPSLAEAARHWAAEECRAGHIPVVYVSDTPEAVAVVQSRLGKETSGSLLEGALAGIAQGLYRDGVRHFIVAGGETSGAVVKALGVSTLQIGAQIAPGVPWTVARAQNMDPVALALKSGNFGGPDFFEQAMSMQP